MDALVLARNELVTRLLTHAPANYRLRIIALLALYILLFVQSTVFLLLWFRECHRDSKSMKVIHIQKTARGSMISVQALCAYAFFQVMITVLGGIRQGIIYIGYFQGGDRTLATVLYVPILTGACFSALAFTFSHLNAAILLFANKSRSKITKRAWIPIYNVAFVAFPLVWTGIIVSQGVKIVIAERKNFIAGKEVLPLLDTVISDPPRLTPTTFTQLQSLQAIIRENAAITIQQRKGICLLGIVYCVFFAIMCIVGLWVIHILRKSARETTRIIRDADKYELSPKDGLPRKIPHGFALAGRGAKSAGAPSPVKRKVSTASKAASRIVDDGHTLKRLLRNLQSSVPLVLLLSTYFPIGVLYHRGANPGWLWEEFRNDIFAWPWTVINNIIFTCFIFNSLRKPSKNNSTGTMTVTPDLDEYEESVENQLTSSQQRGADKVASETPILNLQLECAYPPPSPLSVKEESIMMSEKGQNLQKGSSSSNQGSGRMNEKSNYTWI